MFIQFPAPSTEWTVLDVIDSEPVCNQVTPTFFLTNEPASFLTRITNFFDPRDSKKNHILS